MSQSALTIFFLVLYVVSIIGIGLKYNKSKNSEDYFLASRKLPSSLLAITFIASWWGGGSAVDLVDQAYSLGLSSFWIYGMPVLFSTFLMFLLAKGIRNIGSISQSQLMEERYNSQSALLLTVFTIIYMIIAASVQVIVVGNFFSSYFDISYELGAVIGVLIVLSYATLGGFRGVVLTDLLQFVFFLFTSVALCYMAYIKAGSWDAVKESAIVRDQVGYTSFFYGVSDQLAYVITFGFSWVISANVWQRISAAKNIKSSRKVMFYSFLVFIPLYLMVVFTGMFTSVAYDSIPEGGIVPHLISEVSNPLISAIMFLGLCSAMMSTMDSLLNTCSLALTVDLCKKYITPDCTPKKMVQLGQITTVLSSIVTLTIALNIKSILQVSWIGSDYLTTGVVIPLTLGFVWKRGNSKGAMASMLFGLIFSTYNFAVALGAEFPVFYEIASVEQAIIGISISFVLYVSVSLLTQNEKNNGVKFIEKTKGNVIGNQSEDKKLEYT